MRPSRLLVAVAATAAMVTFPVAPSGAGTNHAITVDPTTVKPGDETTVTGTSGCPSVGYTVTLSYTNPEDAVSTATFTGTTNAEGGYTQAVTIPETAVADEPASITSSAECSGGAVASNTVNLTIEAHEGTLTVSPTSGETGTTVTINGTNCWGDDVAVGFGDGEEFPYEVEDVTLNEDRTFTGTFVIPDDAGPGEYAFAAICPGTDFPLAPFTVVAGEDETAPPPSAPPAAPPATPVVDTPNFTG